MYPPPERKGIWRTRRSAVSWHPGLLSPGAGLTPSSWALGSALQPGSSSWGLMTRGAKQLVQSPACGQHSVSGGGGGGDPSFGSRPGSMKQWDLQEVGTAAPLSRRALNQAGREERQAQEILSGQAYSRDSCGLDFSLTVGSF